jgi:hypothetical protein
MPENFIIVSPEFENLPFYNNYREFTDILCDIDLVIKENFSINSPIILSNFETFLEKLENFKDLDRKYIDFFSSILKDDPNLSKFPYLIKIQSQLGKILKFSHKRSSSNGAILDNIHLEKIYSFLNMAKKRKILVNLHIFTPSDEFIFSSQNSRGFLDLTQVKSFHLIGNLRTYMYRPNKIAFNNILPCFFSFPENLPELREIKIQISHKVNPTSQITEEEANVPLYDKSLEILQSLFTKVPNLDLFHLISNPFIFTLVNILPFVRKNPAFSYPIKKLIYQMKNSGEVIESKSKIVSLDEKMKESFSNFKNLKSLVLQEDTPIFIIEKYLPHFIKNLKRLEELVLYCAPTQDIKQFIQPLNACENLKILKLNIPEDQSNEKIIVILPEIEQQNIITMLKESIPKLVSLSHFHFCMYELNERYTDEFAKFIENNMKNISTLVMLTNINKKEYKFSPQKITLEQKTGPRAPSNPEKQNLPPQKKHKKA